MVRRKLSRHWLISACLLLTVPSSGQAADQAPSLEEQIAAAVTMGQAQWLEAGGERFLGIYTKAATPSPLGAAIILPGLSASPDCPDVIAPLRKGLPNYRWSTLSIQLPTPAQGSDGVWQLEPYFTASLNRIQAAIKFLEQQGITNIALIGHGLGAAAAEVSVSGKDPLKVAAFAGISLGVPQRSGPAPYQPDLFENIHVSTLDIFGGRDLDEVTQTAAARLAAAQRGGFVSPNHHDFARQHPSASPRLLPSTEQKDLIVYSQLQVMGADYRFRGAEQTLLSRIAGWLKKHAVAPPAAGVAKS